MRIDKVTVKNFRNLAEIEVPLQRGTVLVGENRVGKSNFIHAVRLVLDPTLPNSERYLRREDF
jgi:putative ATP-dependent endonuclease of the OLD family